MSALRNFKTYLLGTLEIALFMPAFLTRFENSLHVMLRSYLVILFNITVSLIGVYIMAPDQDILKELPMPTALMLYSVKMLLAVFLSLGFSYLVLRALKKLDVFFQYITVLNWTSLIGTLLALPPLMTVILGWNDWADIYPILVVFALYGYACGAFVITYVLKIQWHFGMVLAIFGMAINETLSDILSWATGFFAG